MPSTFPDGPTKGTQMEQLVELLDRVAALEVHIDQLTLALGAMAALARTLTPLRPADDSAVEID